MTVTEEKEKEISPEPGEKSSMMKARKLQTPPCEGARFPMKTSESDDGLVCKRLLSKEFPGAVEPERVKVLSTVMSERTPSHPLSEGASERTRESVLSNKTTKRTKPPPRPAPSS